MVRNRIFINGKDYTQWASGLNELTESISKKDDGTIEIGQSSQIILTGLGYTYWKEIFLDDSCTSIDREYEVRIKVESCNQNLDFIIKSQGVSIDEVNCKIKMNFNTKNSKDEQIAILQKTYFWDEDYGFIQEYKAKGRIERMLYVKELTFISKILIYFYVVALIPIITAIEIVLNIIDLIIDFINGIGGNLSRPGTDFEKFKEQIESDLIGAGEYTTVYYFKDIFEFWAKQAGLTFRSSILQQEPYSNAVLWGQQIKKGIELKNCDKVTFDKDNAPKYNCIELLNLLSPVFNADWEIIGNELIFERKDYFQTIRKTLFNLDEEVRAGRMTDGWDYSFDNQNQYAQLKADFSFDAVDTQGNRNVNDYYSNVIDWNQGLIHKNRKGRYTPRIEFGACRFTDDSAKNNVNSWMWHNARGQFIFDIDLDYSHSLVLTNDTAQLPKIIIVDQTSSRYFKGCLFRFAVKKQVSPPTFQSDIFGDSVGIWNYNMPMWLNNKIYPGNNLVDKFHYIENPDLKGNRFVEIKSLTWKPQDFCAAVEFVREHKLNMNITSKRGDATIGSLTIEYGACQINITELKFKCNGVS